MKRSFTQRLIITTGNLLFIALAPVVFPLWVLYSIITTKGASFTTQSAWGHLWDELHR